MSKTNKIEMKLHEKINLKNLNLLISSKDIGEETKNQLEAYKKKRTDTCVPVNYSFSKNLKDKGRLYAQNSLSLQNFKKEIRHFLAKDIYYDIDMINAHPVLIHQYCKKHDIECESLEKYVKERDEILTNISKYHDITRDDAKKLMLRLCYLGKYVIEEKDEDTKEITETEPKKKMKFVQSFQEELKEIASSICDLEKEIYALVKKDKNKTHKKSVTLSITAQLLEHKCLMAMVDYFKQQNVGVGVLCFDGLMIEKGSKIGDLNKMLLACEKYVYSKTKYNIKLMEKPMDKELSYQIKTFNPFVESDKGAQERLFEIEGKDKFKFCGGDLYIFNEKTGMYETQIETLYYYLAKNHEFLNVDVGKKVDNYGTSYVLMSKVTPFVKMAAKDEDWLYKTANSSLGYLLFNDGIYKMKTGEFTKGFSPKIVFHARIPWNYPERKESEVKNAYKISFGRLFENPQPMIASLARAIAGDTSVKKFYLCPGKTNAGKSFLSKMLENAFGDYIGNFNAESLAYSSKLDTKDEAAKMRWALLLRFRRILLSNEINMKAELNGNAIKKHSSGGDKMIGRNHGNSEVPFNPHYTIFCMLNDIPKIEPMDEATLKRLEYLEFPYKFVDENEKDNREYYKVRDPELNAKITRESFIRGFIHIILDGYQDYLDNGMPEYDQDVKKKWTTENKQNVEIISKIKEYYDITQNKKDTVSIQDMKKFKETHKKVFKTISPHRFDEILSEELELTKGRNAQVRCWTGIKKKNPIEL